MVLAKEDQRFMETTDDIGILAAGATVSVDLNTLRNKFGNNFNTLIIKNNAAEEISLSLDGIKTNFVGGSGDVFSFDWESGLNYSILEITNEDGAASTSANEIRITVGRTGPN